jgi:hypothetical protein
MERQEYKSERKFKRKFVVTKKVQNRIGFSYV